jgi:predicted site-specific integrase-resolvase
VKPYRGTIEVERTMVDQTEACRMVGVARSTFRHWVADGLLAAVPGSTDLLGYPMYKIADVVTAERSRRKGRSTRRSA